MFSKDDIKEMLLHYQDKPNMPIDLIEAMLATVSAVQHTPERGLVVVLDVDGSPSADQLEALQNDADSFLKKILPDEERISVVLTAERQAPPPIQSKQAKQQKKISLPQIKSIVAISSGKGGVGKSTVAMNLAVALAKQGLKVGLLDADVHGPSQPTMLGVNQRAELNAQGKIMPTQAHGLKTMSIGYLLENQGPIVWRGPMVQKALMQMLGDVDWGELDILLLDMPPGTGDIPLTVAQNVPMSGAVVISTPQDIALLDAMKGLEMFEKLSVDVLGIIENMSMFTCPHCGEDTELFGHGGARHEAEKRDIPFLGEIPLTLEIRQSADTGQPVIGKAEEVFAQIAQELWNTLQTVKKAA